MKEVIRKKLLKILKETIEILAVREKKDWEELKELSDQVIEEVALFKSLDLISLSVLIYSLYKIVKRIPPQDYQKLLAELKWARKHLEENNLSRYNKSLKFLFEIVRKSNAKIKEHLAEVMHAARIKKGAVLLQKGLSLGQAAGLMGLSNWDLQQYIGKTTALEQHQEIISAEKRLKMARRIFGL